MFWTSICVKMLYSNEKDTELEKTVNDYGGGGRL